MHEVNCAVLVKNAGISHCSLPRAEKLVFNNVNLTVPVGTVYGLLGPSGCGKTTLLKCILGRRDLDQGSISVFGHRPGTLESGVPGPGVGYMPQDTCMHVTFTIGECWTYYGTILGMSKKQINDAIVYFVKLLNLPPSNTVINYLSGGELRRVAFATALIHEPKLLILDEPTVGIDCITKKNMWEHLLKLANEKHTSIILTTHYIEEAKAAHQVGLMHGGTLAVEDYTSRLLQRFNCNSLENVFLKICFQPSSTWNDNDVVDNRISRVNGQISVQDDECYSKGNRKIISRKDFHVRSHVLKALILKNLIHLYRYPGVLVFVMLLPCIQFSTSVFSTTEDFGKMQLGFVNEDLGPLGDQYSKFIAEDIIFLKHFNSSSKALTALRGGHLEGLIVISEKFSDAHLERIVKSPFLKYSVLNDSVISVTLSNIVPQSSFSRFHLLDSYQRFLVSTYNNSGLNPMAARPVFLFGPEDLRYLSHPQVLQMDQLAIVVVAYFAPATLAIFTLFVELNCGYLERTFVAGVTSTEIVLGLLVMLLAVAIVQEASTLLMAYFLVFEKLSWGTSGLLLLVCYFTGISGMAAGIFLSLFVSQVTLLLVISGTVLLITVSISGGFWPLVAAPHFARYIFTALPLAYPLKAIGAVYSDANFYLTEVTCSLAVSLTHTFLFLTLSVVILRIKA